MMRRRFVILLHSASAEEHWDLMFEKETDLTTWSLPPQPLPLSAFQVSAEKLPPHRKDYLDYEGEIRHNRGTVRRIDAGLYENEDKDADEKSEPSVFRVYGQIMDGTLSIQNGVINFCPEIG